MRSNLATSLTAAPSCQALTHRTLSASRPRSTMPSRNRGRSSSRLIRENRSSSMERMELSRFGGQVTFEVRNGVAKRTVLLTEPAGQASAGQ